MISGCDLLFILIIIIVIINHYNTKDPELTQKYFHRTKLKKKYLDEDKHFNKNFDRDIDFGYLEDLEGEDFDTHFHND